MVNTMRAGLSLAMLAGFFAVAAAQLAAAVALAFWLSTVIAGAIAVKLVWSCFAGAVLAVGRGTWKAIRSRPEAPAGLLLTPGNAPVLWTTVRELAAEAGTRAPDEIWLIPEVNAAVQEESRLLGLVGGRRRLCLGLPLLHTMTVAQVRAVLAHELGHYSGKHTRLSAPAYRGRLVIAHTLRQIGPYNPAGWIFKGYARLYLLADNAVSRRQEFEADRVSAGVAGVDAAASALHEIRVLDAAWSFFLDRYVELGWESGFAPDDLFAGFGALVAARRGELDELRGSTPEESGSLWDTHPPLNERISAIRALPRTSTRPDERPAAVLVPDLTEAGRALQGEVVATGERTVLPWPQFTAATLGAMVQREADAVFRTVARTTGRPEVGLADVLDLIASDRLTEIAQPFFPTATRREVGTLFAEPLETVLRLAALRSGVAGWRHSWSGSAEFVGMDGTPVALEEIARTAVSPGGLDKVWAELDRLGIDAQRAAPAERAPTTFGSQVLGGLANVKVEGTEYDLVVLSTGLVLVAGPGTSDQGRQRMRELVGSTPAAKLAEWYRFVPYEEITSARVSKEIPLRAELTLHGGAIVPLEEKWTSEELDKGSRDRLVRVLGEIG
ncbi:M48 family metallopeptidase [Microtetraspora sp. AC03309]|uniref:M48 family metallopeptidase n=1 Tax=Microtetraspora sp. AC03309 TaxID=2779376 RepID=UPI001E40A659|nr:M48 family metallopeptidase [Microtetraspora sp. AC03309]